MKFLMIMAYNLTLIIGTTWLVAERGWSMWTYLLCVLFMLHFSKAKDDTTTT
jgi:hypothetical protein